jgi:penicillin-insensitive murein endopeptidase
VALVVAGVAALAVAGILARAGGASRAPAPPAPPPAAAASAARTAAGSEGEAPLARAHGVLVPPPREPVRTATAHYPAIHWRRSHAVGLPFRGSLRDGVLLPAYGRDYVTWDPVLNRYPNRDDRRWGTARLIRTLLYVLDRYRRAHPRAPRVLIGDLSRPRGGRFTGHYGGLGHASHQNGLDIDVLYPRKDRKELPADPRTMDRRLSQELVNRFVNAYARFVFVGPHTGLHGKRGVVQTLVNHDDHMHVRIYP